MAEPVNVAGLFGAAVCDALGAVDETARANAELEVAGEVVSHLGDYVPVDMPRFPAELTAWRHMDVTEIQSALANPNLNVGPVFTEYRLKVTEYEAQNAQRLLVLCSTFHSLIRARAQKPRQVDQAIATIGGWIERVWRLEPPLSGDLRSWARSKTWRLDVLPRAWRHL